MLKIGQALDLFGVERITLNALYPFFFLLFFFQVFEGLSVKSSCELFECP